MIRLRKLGVPGEPVVGPAKTLLALSLAQAPVRVPEVVTGLPDTLNSAGRLRATLVTVPVGAAPLEAAVITPF